MTLEQTIENMKVLIDDLSKENEELKTQVEALQLTINMSDESTKKAKEIIEQCGEAYAEYTVAIAEAKKAQEEYSAAVKELYILKKKYQKEMEKLIDEI